VAHVAVSPELSAWIASRIAHYAAEATEPYQKWEAPDVIAFEALPLIRHWFETFGLRADGEIVRWHTDGLDPYPGVKPVDDRIDQLSALVEGARRYPELRSLLPPREPGSLDCPCMEHSVFASGRLICRECGGLGWVQRPGPESSPESGGGGDR
jgi:hypothetical protein